ncbi:hypothetical protein AA313_de0208960 [Arthrobotrys entomopaga]|nr:hypothetical protein AA313_de0208960 [Arthrobotrys entomopaga]
MSPRNNSQIGSFTNSSDSSISLSLPVPLRSIEQEPDDLPNLVIESNAITNGGEPAVYINLDAVSQNLNTPDNNTGAQSPRCTSCSHSLRTVQCTCPTSTRYSDTNDLHRYLEMSGDDDDDSSGTDYSLSRYISASDREVPWSCVNVTLRPVDLAGSIESLSLSDESFELLEGLDVPETSPFQI